MTIHSSQPDLVAAMRPVLDTALDAVIFMRADGTVAGWNAAAEQTFGWTNGEAVGRLMADLIIPDAYKEGHNDGLDRYNATGEERVLGRRIEISALHKDGREIPVELSITTAPAGGERLFIGFLRDISERKLAETRMLRQAREAELLFQITRKASETGSFEEALHSCLEAICQLTGWPVGHAFLIKDGNATELVSSDIWFEAVEGGSAGLRDATARLRFTAGVGLPGAILESGEPSWMPDAEAEPKFARKGLGFHAAFGFPIKSEGSIIAVLEFFTHDMTQPDADLMLIVRTLGEQVGRVLERKRTEAHQRLLVNELNHRVKNTLAIVQSVASQTLKGEGVSDAARLALESRLAAIAAAHDILTDESWEAAPIHQVVEKAVLGCGADQRRYRIAGPDLRLQPRTTVSLAMALHELCTNAVKYGALSNESGIIDVSWEIVGGDEKRLILRWMEQGGPPVSPPAQRGFGTRMIERGLASEMGGAVRLEFLPTGVSCILDAPLPNQVEPGLSG